ncbi:MAG: hypothetical protein WDM91_07850 [Rhizomicrobium sp.]
MNRIYVPSTGAESWKPFLPEPERQWKTGYSARTLAHSWEAADGLPPEIAERFAATPGFKAVPELLIAIPEHKVPLPGGTTESQNDVFALLRCGDRTIAMAVEGKVAEPFGQTVGDWRRGASEGKQARLRYLCGALGIDYPPPDHLFYQLFHRAGSAIIEAGRFKTDAAVMIVHSFSPHRHWFEEYAAFVSLLGGAVSEDALSQILLPSGMPFYTGWVCGDAQFLER